MPSPVSKQPSKQHASGGESAKAAHVVPDQTELLAFYKRRVVNAHADEFEQEREALLSSVDQTGVHAADLHALDWENRKRTDEIRELQKALSDAHAFLFEERQRLLTLQAENDELRLQEIEDRRRIQQLLSRDPSSLGGQQPSGLRAYSTDALLLKVEALQAQLNEQKQLASEHIAALLEDRRIREFEEAAHRAHMNQQLEAKEQRLKVLEEQHRLTTKDYILARRDKQAAEERAVAADTALQEERQQAAQDLATARRKAEKDLKEAKQNAETKVEDVAANLRKQLKAKVDEVVNLTSVHGALKAQFEKRITDLEDKHARAVHANKQLEIRRFQDMEGFTADVTHLRKTLTAVDRKLHEMRLVERLEDDDRLDTILNHLRRTRPDTPVKGSSAQEDTDARSDVHSVKGELLGGLQDVRGRVKGLEERLAAKKKVSLRL